MSAGADTSVSFEVSVNSSDHSGRSRKLPSLLFFFFGSRGSSPSLRSWAGLVEDKSCNVDVEDELPPELADSLGTTRGTKLSILQIIVFLPSVNRGFLPQTHSQENPWSSKSFPSDRTAGDSSSNLHCHEEIKIVNVYLCFFVCMHFRIGCKHHRVPGSSRSIQFI